MIFVFLFFLVLIKTLCWGCSLFNTERQIKYLGRMIRLKDHNNYIEVFLSEF